MVETFLNYIDGQWTQSAAGETFTNTDPTDPSTIVGHFQRSNGADARQAIAAAERATDDWAEMPAPKRGRILRRASNVLAERAADATESLVREEGKTRSEAAGEVQRAVDIFAYYGEKAADIGGTVKSATTPNSQLYTVSEPIGVAALITPWNYPIAIPAWKLAPALVTGNTVVLKPASLAPNSSRILIECLIEAGIPEGVVNYVTGPGSTVGSEFVTHNNVDAISFTGSSAVGDVVYEAASKDQKRVQLEMGGKNPVMVMPSADIDEAAAIATDGAFGVTGQACTATSRAIVHEDVHDEFVTAVVHAAESIRVGNGLSEADMGPQVAERELEDTLEYVNSGIESTATLETGGHRLQSGEHSAGHYIAPTVFSAVEPDMRIAKEEIFGPVLSVISVSNFAEGIAVANAVEYGLSASIVTNDLSEANRFIEEIDAGVVKVNEKTTGLELHVPFGGRKASSSETYREQGDAGLEFFSISKTVYMKY